MPNEEQRSLPPVFRRGPLQPPTDKATEERILVCGNPQMLDDLRDALTDRGLRPDRSREPGHFAFENYW